VAINLVNESFDVYPIVESKTTQRISLTCALSGGLTHINNQQSEQKKNK